ncbi:indolepyruvate ferredoxin oxidoreductase subunit alpha [Desulfococcus sp.]|uniref:indolepyruvate ferredoxin oxidoreductase subunit alpha n=1 Tax=Desulfococcus sp. TaxID=2025834 RepID=UPI003D1044ED
MHRLLTDEPGRKMLLLGNDAIARGAVEAGLAFASTYPGTPSSEISANLFQISQETDLYFEYSTNEKVALEVAAAAANANVRAMCMMKHVGLNVASDVLMTLAYIGVKAGMVIVVADDPFMFSSQNEQDTRYYAKLSGLPMVEPSSVEEAKEMVPYAFDLSETLGEPVIFRTTTRVNHSNGVVTLGPLKPRVPNGDFTKDPLRYVCVPAVSRKLHVRLLDRWEQARKIADTSAINTIEGDGSWGIVCNGVSYNYAVDAVAALNIKNRTRILRLGFSHPMPGNLVKGFLKDCERVLVVEEGEPYMEESIKALAQEEGLTLPIRGKGQDLFSRLYEFDPVMVRKGIAACFDLPFAASAPPDLSDLPEIPQRPPTLCAGCSHRATFYAVKKAAEGLDTIYPSDIGCYTLGFLPPLSMADFVVCMGASVGTACGFSKVTKKKVVAFIGDSTFFHSGIPGLINAVFNNHDFTLVILDNGTTAMTGHQPNPGVDMEKLNLHGYGRISIESVVKSLGVQHVTVIKPFKVKKSIAAVREAIEYKGVSVIISQEMCSLYAKGLKELKDRVFHVSDKCVNHRNCIDDLACPAFYIKDDRVHIDPDLCWGCAVCAQICPENAILPLKK